MFETDTKARAPFFADDFPLRVACFLVFLSLLLSGCGCGSRGRQAGKTRLVLATGAAEPLRPILLLAIDEFESEHPGVEVQLLTVPGNYYQKLLVMVAGRTAPDLMWMGQSFAEFATRGAFLDLSSRIAAEVDLSEYHQKVLSWYCLDGKQYGIPYGIDLEFIVYNKKLFEEASVPFPKDGWTLDEFLSTAQKLTKDRDGDGHTDQFGYRGEINESVFGGAAISYDGERALCDRPAMIEAIQFNLDLVHKWKVAPSPEQQRQESADPYTIFRQGKAAMMRFYTWNITHLRERCAGMDWDIVGIPVGRRRAHWASSAAYLVSADTRHPEEAWLLFRKMISDKMQRALSLESFPANLRVGRELVRENTQRPANLRSILEATEYLYPNPRVPNLQELLHHYYSAREKVFAFYGTSQYVPPKQAMAEAARRINETIRKRKRKH